jgi:hypothetical protein
VNIIVSLIKKFKEIDLIRGQGLEARSQGNELMNFIRKGKR